MLRYRLTKPPLSPSLLVILISISCIRQVEHRLALSIFVINNLHFSVGRSQNGAEPVSFVRKNMASLTITLTLIR